MTVEAYLSRLPGGWYPTAPSRVGRYLRYTVKGSVWGSHDTDIVEIESRRGIPAIMLLRPVSPRTARKRGGRWRTRFFSNTIEEAFKHYPYAHNRLAVAVHEAGHAVVAKKLGLQPEFAELRTRPSFDRDKNPQNIFGRVVFADRLPRSIENATMTMAGPIAEYSVTHELIVEGSDLNSFFYCTEDSGQSRSAMKHAQQILADNWDEVIELAHELLFHRTVHITSDIAPAHQEHPAKEASA
jgi:hypothetical protein